MQRVYICVLEFVDQALDQAEHGVHTVNVSIGSGVGLVQRCLFRSIRPRTDYSNYPAIRLISAVLEAIEAA